VIFAGFTMFDFQRLRTNQDEASAPLLAASTFLDVLNVFLFFLEIFSGPEGGCGDERHRRHPGPARIWTGWLGLPVSAYGTGSLIGCMVLSW
jgi:hypothetical protein